MARFVRRIPQRSLEIGGSTNLVQKLHLHRDMTHALRGSDHSFHIPVMGTGFTIDTPIRVAKLGIESSISLVNDDLVEAARKHHCAGRLLPYQEIVGRRPGARARRITEYLNLVDRLTAADTARLQASAFDDAMGIRRYFDLLPEDAPKKKAFLEVERMTPGPRREKARDELRPLIQRGSIGVNIMTKLDGSTDSRGKPLPEHDSEAHAALRGFAESTLSGKLILSAGANPGLFAYLAQFPDFFPNAEGVVKKEIVLKVSDFRSAHVQGRLLSRRGLWVSEYRIESGLNCGGHAFPTEGKLMGPILAAFRDQRHELRQQLFPAYEKGLVAMGIEPPSEAPPVRITAQGGIGTAGEDSFLREHFALDSTGWGSPFLMVPEVVSLDDKTMESLITAQDGDVKLSWSSPLGVRFWWLTTCASEEARVARIQSGVSGSICTARHVALNTEFGDVPLCTGSRAYQKRKKEQLDPNDPDYALKVERIEGPACICVDLGGAFLTSTTEEQKPPPPAICPGPNVVNFQGRFSLEEMVGHIYGRRDIVTKKDRPHVFLREIELYFEVFDEDLELLGTGVETRTEEQLTRTLDGLEEGLSFYRTTLGHLPAADRSSFEERLLLLHRDIVARRLALAQRLVRRRTAS